VVGGNLLSIHSFSGKTRPKQAYLDYDHLFFPRKHLSGCLCGFI